ncbi:MAG: c-type cytochrome [Verrucomicrobiaceae bacterium]|nr:c-type cytochrome [Verrucomicrobiaceae bacterium]
MRPILLIAFALLANIPVANCAPLVVGFERFHAAKPDAIGGQLLYNELGCINCHGGDKQLPLRNGPVLPGIMSRYQSEWVKQFLTNPHSCKEGTNMPHLLAESEVDAVMHYLASIKTKTSKPKSAKYLNAERGSDVYHTAGCVACHQPGKDFQPPTGVPAPASFSHSSIALPDLKAKYSLGTLMDFLTDPLKIRTDNRMPHTKLEASDVTDLAAFLLDMQQSDGSIVPGIKTFKLDPSPAKQGIDIVKRSGCASCHQLPAEVRSEVRDIANIDGGCMSSSPRVRYDLSQAQRAALKAYLGQRSAPTSTKVQASLTLQALNCTQCHVRDGVGGPDTARKAYFTGDHNLGDTGMLPPPLGEAGRKMHIAWMTDVLAGKKRIRPYLQTQMPVYAQLATTLPALLKKADEITEKPLPKGQPEAGQKLLGTMGGLGCITCHRWGDRPSLGIQALDIRSLATRIQGPWLRDYLINPASHRPGTLMPSFWPGGKAANQTILGGDTDAQIASILAFSATGNGLPEGYPAMQAGEFELLPKDRPIIQRTFMESVGAKAIVVGFPAGIHLAYDADHCHPALVWKGRFFDAYNTWFTRAAPFEKPLGDVIGRWPDESSGADAKRFGGYKLDSSGVPTFLFQVGSIQIQERLEPKDGQLYRHLSWDSSKMANVTISHPPEAQFQEAADSRPGQLHYIYSWK